MVTLIKLQIIKTFKKVTYICQSSFYVSDRQMDCVELLRRLCLLLPRAPMWKRPLWNVPKGKALNWTNCRHIPTSNRSAVHLTLAMIWLLVDFNFCMEILQWYQEAVRVVQLWYRNYCCGKNYNGNVPDLPSGMYESRVGLNNLPMVTYNTLKSMYYWLGIETGIPGFTLKTKLMLTRLHRIIY